MSVPLIVGLDLSLTGTGVCVDGACDTIRVRQTGMDRLHSLRQEILEACEWADLVVIEGYAMGTTRQSMSYAVGELGGIVRYSLWDLSRRYVEVPPATLKQFATGKGNANKDAMVATAARIGCPADDNNAVDAWWLYQMGVYWWAAAYGWGGETLSKSAYRDKAVAAVSWATPSAAV